MLSDGKNSVQAKQWLDKCYLYSALLETMVKRWYADFKRGCIDTNNAESSGRPNLEVVLENTKKLILADGKLKLREIAEELKTLFCMTICHCVQSGWCVCSQSIKNNNTLMIQSVVCNCFNTTKKSFCINMRQQMKYGSITSLQSQIGNQLSEQQQVKAIQSDQRYKHQQARFWPPYFGMCKVFC